MHDLFVFVVKNLIGRSIGRRFFKDLESFELPTINRVLTNNIGGTYLHPDNNKMTRANLYCIVGRLILGTYEPYTSYGFLHTWGSFEKNYFTFQ